MTVSDAVGFFAGAAGYPTQFMKGKSDYATKPISEQGLDVFMTGLTRGLPKYVVCDAYGGSLAETGAAATAFVHRGNASACIRQRLERSRRYAGAPR